MKRVRLALGVRLGLAVMPGERDLEQRVSHVSPGSRIHVIHPMDARSFSFIETCTRLMRAGLEPIPRILIKSIRKEDELHWLLLQLSARADVKEIIISEMCGPKSPGPFQSAADILALNIIQKYGIFRVGIEPGEGPVMQVAALQSLLSRKTRRLKLSQIYFAPCPGEGLMEALRWRAAFQAARLRIKLLGSTTHSGKIKEGLEITATQEDYDLMQFCDDAAFRDKSDIALLSQLDGICLYEENAVNMLSQLGSYEAEDQMPS